MRALLFDFDGTIANSMAVALELWNEIAAEKGYRQVSHPEIPELQHLGVKELLKHLGVRRRKLPGLLIHGEKRLRGRMDEVEMIDGLKPVLSALRPQFDLFGILTSNSVENVEIFLERHEMSDLFTFVHSTSKLTKKAKYLRRILQEYELEASDCFYVGDEIREMKAARKAGIPGVAVTWGFNSKEALTQAEPAYLFETPADLSGLLTEKSL